MIEEHLKKLAANPDLYESCVSEIIKRHPGAGAFIDGGAHVGGHTATMLARDDVERVYAVEAIPSLCQLIVNELGDDPKLILHQCAVGRVAGKTTFNIAKGAMGYSGLRQRDVSAVTEWEEVLVDVSPLDSLILNQDISQVGLIKLDLEGGEFHALVGATQIIRSSRPLIVFENGLRESAELYGYGWKEFSEFFGGMEYSVYDFFGRLVDSQYWDGVLQTYMFVAFPSRNETDVVKTLLPGILSELL